MNDVSSIDTLRDLVADLPADAEDEALAALAALTDPDVRAAALEEQALVERLAAAVPHLVRGAFTIVDAEPVERELDDGTVVVVTGSHVEGPTICPDCTRGTRAVAPNVLACITLPARVGTLDGQPGDIVACGKER